MVRPSEYKEEYPEKLLEYFRAEGKFPTIEGFCANNMISKQSFHTWLKEHKELLDAYDLAKQLQKNRLISGALDREYDSGFSKFFAINCLDMVEKSQQEVTTQTLTEREAWLAKIREDKK
jgi:hypothetical protein